MDSTGSPTDPCSERRLSPEFSSTPFPQSPQQMGPPLHVPHQGPCGERSFIFRASGLFIHLYPSRSPIKEPHTKKTGKNIWSPPMELHVDGRPTCNGVRPGSPRVNDTAITTPVPCSLQHDTFHLGLGRPEPR